MYVPQGCKLRYSLFCVMLRVASLLFEDAILSSGITNKLFGITQRAKKRQREIAFFTSLMYCIMQIPFAYKKVQKILQNMSIKPTTHKTEHWRVAHSGT